MQFQIPQRSLFDETDLEEFKTSDTYREIHSFIKSCSEAVIGSKISDIVESNPIVDKLASFMEVLIELIQEFPPLNQPMRYGNKAFRDWYRKMCMESKIFIDELLPEDLKSAGVELYPYLTQSFGNEVRIDYGTGHELSINVFFMCLYKLHLLTKSDLKVLILKGFSAYLKCVRRLQETYMLEPAGSHGVWGLDDYHCLTFVYGSAQLINHDIILPNSINDINIVHTYSNDYLYIEGIQFIKKVKSRAPFHETSPMLYDISSLSDWTKVHVGLIRLFQGEVLNKLPVIQHLPFGSLIRCTWTPSQLPSPHSHVLTEDHIKSIQQQYQQQQQQQQLSTSLSSPSSANMSHTHQSLPSSPPSRISVNNTHSISSNSTNLQFEVHTRAPWASPRK